MNFMVLKSRPIFVVESFLTERAFTAVKGDAKFETKYVKGVITKHLLNTPTRPLPWAAHPPLTSQEFSHK